MSASFIERQASKSDMYTSQLLVIRLIKLIEISIDVLC